MSWIRYDSVNDRLEESTDGGSNWVTLDLSGQGLAGSGDVVGPASAVDNNVAVYNTTTGKLIKDGGQTIAQIIAAGGAAGAWPIGSIFISVSATNPGTSLGFGTWVSFGAGRVLVGLDSGDTDFDVSEEVGGAKTVASSAQAFGGSALATHQHAGVSAGTPAGTISGVAVSDHASHTHSVTSNVTVTDHASHTHSVTSNVAVGAHTISGSTGQASAGATARGTTASTLTLLVHTHTAGTLATSAHSVTNNAVTSGDPSATLTHSVTNNAVTSAGPSATLTHTVSSSGTFTGSAMGTHQHDAITAGTPAGTNTPGTATSVVQPYIVVYMFKRTA